MSEALQALQDEATDPDGSSTILLDTVAGSADMHVKAIAKWKASGIRAMRQGDFDTWAEKALDAESYKQWLRLDPDMDEVETFFKVWAEKTGQSSGKSRASGTSSKRTVRQ